MVGSVGVGEEQPLVQVVACSEELGLQESLRE